MYMQCSLLHELPALLEGERFKETVIKSAGARDKGPPREREPYTTSLGGCKSCGYAVLLPEPAAAPLAHLFKTRRVGVILALSRIYTVPSSARRWRNIYTTAPLNPSVNLPIVNRETRTAISSLTISRLIVTQYLTRRLLQL